MKSGETSDFEVVVLAACICAVVAYVVCHALGAPLFQYLPIERAFVWRAPSGHVAMSLYGYMAWSAIAALVAGGAALWPALRRTLARRRPLLRALFAAALALAFVYIAVVETLHWIV